jgi:hypothetical protein
MFPCSTGICYDCGVEPEAVTVVEVTNDGTHLSERVEAVRGTVGNPMTRDEALAKAHEPMAPVFGEQACANLINKDGRPRECKGHPRASAFARYFHLIANNCDNAGGPHTLSLRSRGPDKVHKDQANPQTQEIRRICSRL